jgi:hypothetical protein
MRRQLVGEGSANGVRLASDCRDMREKRELSAPRQPNDGSGDAGDDDVIRIEDLAPRGNVTGGRKILLGEIPTPVSNPLIRPES